MRISVQFYRSTRQVVDLDNLLKHLHDAAEGVIWVNDCQITAYGVIELHLDREDPRTDLAVEIHSGASMTRLYDPVTGKVLT